MTLLTTMLQRPLDPGYAAAAARRSAAGHPPATSLRSIRVLLVALSIGLVLGVCAYHLTARSDARTAGRAELIDQIEQRRDDADQLSTRARALESQVATLEGDLLGDPRAAARARQLAIGAGAVALEGPGVVLTLDDAVAGDDAPSGPDEDAAQGRVLARDLQFVVNALWQAGAEAVAINDRRLTSTSAIRFAGSALIVDYRPLTRPYVITALGEPRTFSTAFADGPGGSYLSTLRSTFGVRVESQVSTGLRVPAAAGRGIRYARPGASGRADSPAPSTSPSPAPAASSSDAAPSPSADRTEDTP